MRIEADVRDVEKGRAGRCRPYLRSVSFTLALVLFGGAVAGGPAVQAPPQRLQDTGLYSDVAALEIDPAHVAFSPRHQLWTDGAVKRRWISLPAGAVIDGSDPDAWVFPVGTRLWKEFSFGGRKIETRYLERLADGRWMYATYAWSEDGREAQLVSEKGRRGAFPVGGGRSHAIPSVGDCKACHQGGRSEVLGFSAFQLDVRNPDTIRTGSRSEASIDVETLIARGLLVGFPEPAGAPPWTGEGTDVQRAALGYLHGNCGHCHNEDGPLRNVGLFLRQSYGKMGKPSLESTVGYPVRKAAPGQSPGTALRIDPGQPDRSALLQRVASRYPPLQMPPLGTELVDEEAVRLLRRWIMEADPAGAVASSDRKGHQR